MRSIVKSVTMALIACCVTHAWAVGIDASDCQDRADRLRREARDLADAAETLAGVPAEDASQRRSAQSDVRSHLEDVHRRFVQAASACGSTTDATDPVAIATIRGYLVLTHGDTPSTRARVTEIEAELVALAQLHVKAQPLDYRMTYAMAEVVFGRDSH